LVGKDYEKIMKML